MIGKTRFHLLEYLLLFTSVILLIFGIGFFDLSVPVLDTVSPVLKWLILPLLVFCIFIPARFLVAPRCAETLRALLPDRKYEYLVLFVLFWLPRILYKICIPVAMESDSALYIGLGAEYAATGTLSSFNHVVKITPNIAIYVAVLGFFMRIFGPGAATAQWFCMILNCANIFLFYALARKLTTRGRAFFAAAVFTLIPENVFYSVIPGIEAISLFTMLSGLLLIFSITGKKPFVQVLLVLAGSVVLSLSAFIRPNAWAAIGCAVLWLLCYCGESRARKAILLTAMIVGLVGSNLWHHAFQRSFFPGEQPVGGLGWTLYEGLDMNGGAWSEEKAARCREVIEQYNAAESNRVFTEEAWARFHGYSLTDKIRMFIRKGGNVWYDPGYPVLSIKNPTLFTVGGGITALGSFLCVSVWIACMLFRLRRPLQGMGRSTCMICLAYILSTTLWHEFGTSIGRYRYMMLTFVILMIAVCYPAAAGEASASSQNPKSAGRDGGALK